MTSDKISHKSRQALVLIDVVNHFEFPDGEQILRNALRISGQLRMLKARARKANIPVIYVNDNFGQWRSDAAKLLAYCLRERNARDGHLWKRSDPMCMTIAS
jgi:nicotinamidase-related amidase